MKSNVTTLGRQLRFLSMLLCFLCAGALQISAQNYKSPEDAMQSVKMHIEQLQQDMPKANDSGTQMTQEQQQLFFDYRYLSMFTSKLQELNSVSATMAVMEEQFPASKQSAERADLLTNAHNSLVELITE